MHYFDQSATTKPYDEVIDTITEVLKHHYGNPSSLHRLGVEAEKLVQRARHVIAAALNVNAEGIIFTSGGTESNNLAIKGTAMEYRHRGNHLITTAIEHSSVYESFKQLELQGFRVTYLPVNGAGIISLEQLKQSLTNETIMVSIMHVNNEMGSVQPIEEVGKLLHSYRNIIFHVDAVQSIGQIMLKTEAWGIDLLSVSAHKIRGPKGMGLLYRRPNLQLYPQISGGNQEFGLRGGTENVPYIVAMAKAVRLSTEHLSEHRAKLLRLRAQLIQGLCGIPELIVSGSDTEEHQSPHIVHFIAPGMKSEVIVHALEQHDIYVSSQSACSSKESKPSRVLLAMGLSSSEASSGIRISLSPEHSSDQIQYLIDNITAVISEAKKVARNSTWKRK